MAKKIILVMVTCIILTSVMIVADYVNFSETLSLDVCSINWDFQALLIGNVIVIGLYLITYIVIDRSNVKRSNNQEQSARIILESIYKQCKEMVELFDRQDAVESAVAKCNFSKMIQDDPALTNYRNLPFEFEPYIFEASNNGILAEQEFRDYLEIRERYKQYILMRITFFDAEKYTDNPMVNPGLVDVIAEKRTSLLEKLNKQLLQLSHSEQGGK